MSAEIQVMLRQIRRMLQEIGDRLSCIDHNAGDPDKHWQKIAENDEKVREAAAGLPEDIRGKCPELMKYVNTGRELRFVWGACIDEVKGYEVR